MKVLRLSQRKLFQTMVQIIYTLVVFILALLGTQAAVVPNQKLSHKTPGAPQTKNIGRVGIYNGKSTSIKKHPYMAAVLYYDVFLCAATIISENWIILSADCIYGFEAESLMVVVASDDAGNSGKQYAVVDVVVHPNYGYTYLDYNYGLLKVRGKFKWSKTVKRAKLPKREAKVGSEAVIVGWGETERIKGAWLSGDGTLKEGNMKFISRANCESIYEAQKLTMTDRMGCTYNEGKVTPCDNDWGDPMIEKDTVYQLLIAVGTTNECTSGAYPAINADVFPAVGWIRNITKIQDDME